MNYQCFLVEESGLVACFLRRYSTDRCPSPHGYHSAMVRIEDMNHPPRTMREVYTPPEDPRYPEQCECGYTFKETDTKQLFTLSIYESKATGERWLENALPIGAMFDAWWFPNEWKGADQRTLAVVLPPGSGNVWIIDAPASSGNHWQRTGVPPNITVTPSILTPRYHGFLTNGILIET